MSETQPATLFDKVWDRHVVADFGHGLSLLYIDRHLLHDLSGARALEELSKQGRDVRRPELAFATPDHTVSTEAGRHDDTSPRSAKYVPSLRRSCLHHRIRLFDINEASQGIVHVIGPELGLSLPGTTLVCGDSHTCTHGGVGALAFGIGSTEVAHVLATQTLTQRKPKRMRVRFEGQPAKSVEAKDLILYLIAQRGAAAGTGYAVEFGGSAIRAFDIEARLTICNLAIEFGARTGMVAPDERTFNYLAGRPFAPKDEMWDRALAEWRGLKTDENADFDCEIAIDTAEIAPQVTWGTSPEYALGIDGRIPDPSTLADPAKRRAMEAALAYMDLKPGTPLVGVKIDRVFIGSCTNSRLSDLRAAAAIARGRKVAPGVTAWVVPGSQQVKKAAEAEGLDRIFRAAGFDWREPGCSMCLASNGEVIGPGERCVSTSNRNFVGRQGPGSRSHLASPTTATAAAVTGHLVDVRAFTNAS